MRVLIAGFSHETNTMSAVPTTLDDFDIVTGDAILRERGINSCISGFLEVADREKWEVIPTITARATPAGRVSRDVFDYVLKETLDRLAQAGRLDGILLALHGAMAVEGMPDGGEGPFCSAIRRKVGPALPILSTADPHANVSKEFVEATDGIYGYKTIPHIDMFQSGVRAAEALAAMVKGDLKPVTAMLRIPMMVPSGRQLVGYPTAEGPLPLVYAEAEAWEQKRNIVNVNVSVGFDRSDVPDVGACITVISNNDLALASKAAQAVAQKLWDLREDFLMDTKGPREAVELALEKQGPVVLADMEDAPSGGGTGDGTEVLKTMLEMGVSSSCVWMCDEEAVAKALEAGVGKQVTLTVGGKKVWRIDGRHASPIQLTGKVRAVTDGTWTVKGPSGTGAKVEMGRTVVVNAKGVEVVISERRIDPKDPELFRSVGIEPTERHMIVIKSKHHWRAAWEPVIKEVIVVQCPNDYSLSTMGKARWPYKNVRRPIWPLDEDLQWSATAGV